MSEARAEQFKVKVGTDKPFTPVSIRKEGADPLSLVILLDASRDSFHDLSQIGDDLAALVGSGMDANVHISIYLFDCSMIKTLNNASPDADALREAVHVGMQYPTLHGGKRSSSCGRTVHLWDDVSIAVAALSHMPGRRVLLLVSAGNDGGSKYDWPIVQQYAREQSVAIFGLRDQRMADADDFSRTNLSKSYSAGQGVTGTLAASSQPHEASRMELLCANSGGLVFTTKTLLRKDTLEDFLSLIRQRFILKVPKALFAGSALGNFKVTLPGPNTLYIAATGPSDPLPTPE